MQPESILALYALEGAVTSVRPYGDGHINYTFLVETGAGGAYILQRLSPAAFNAPEKVMENVSRVTAYLRGVIARRGGDPSRETLEIIPLADGREYLLTDEGCWRMYRFIAGARSYQQAENEAVFREAGRGFGRFMRDLAQYPAVTLHETIPRFHDTENRLTAFRAAAARDTSGRADGVRQEIAFVLERGHRAGTLVSAGLPLRVTHNDTKLNNVLMDEQGRALCVIDLDTVMPGLCAYDFGDSIRSGANTAAEDEADLSRVHFSLPMFRAYAEGYLGETGDMLTGAEIDSLPLGAWMMTYECGMRFLMDYLNGDTYYHTTYPTHNLTRARNQFALLVEMERQEAAMLEIVRNAIKE
ncbi:MAG: aminoglycoside phosphotransferase family protein [Clostridiales bacterium]|nr:aminoglycoside phosphotransferase family protein [Clostridiales bacterium]